MLVQDTIGLMTDFIKTQPVWAPLIVGTLAFGESLAIVSLFIPATGILLAIGALAGVADIEYWGIVLGAGIGAGLGDWVSYAFGVRYGQKIVKIRFFSQHPQLLVRAESFFHKWGGLGVFIGRFSGPLRATVPLVAGIANMNPWTFQLANWLSAAIWAPALLSGSAETTKLLHQLMLS